MHLHDLMVGVSTNSATPQQPVTVLGEVINSGVCEVIVITSAVSVFILPTFCVVFQNAPRKPNSLLRINGTCSLYVKTGSSNFNAAVSIM